MENQCGIIILAAGSSSRLGTPKQSLLYKEHTLLEHSIQVALESTGSTVIVVLGAHAAGIQPAVKNAKLFFVVNEAWQEGMASSIRCGLNYLCDKNTWIASALVMACDQPYINAALLNSLMALQWQTGDAVVASEYAGITGIPAVFSKTLFPDLLLLKGDAGAKKIVMQEPVVATVPFALGNIDIDTAADYEKLKQM